MQPHQGPKGDLSAATTDSRVRTTRQIESSLRALIRNTNAALSAAPLAKAAAEAQAQGTTEDIDLELVASTPVEDLPEGVAEERATKAALKAKEEALVQLQLLASTNPDESLDPSIVNWQMVGRKRGVACVDTNIGVVGKGRRLKWSI
jgi:hypothetical protein